MKTMGILGTGRRAVWFAKAFADAGVRVVLGSRHVGRARWVAEGLGRNGITPGSYGDAIAAPFVLPAMLSHDRILATLEPLRDALAGRIYIDVTNRLDADYSTFVLPPETSFAEYVQERFPEVQVVGAFKHTWSEILNVFVDNGMHLDVYIVGDDDTAKRELRAMCRGMPFRFRDAGRLRQARFIEHMTLLSGALGPLSRDVLPMCGDSTLKHRSLFMPADSTSYNPMGRV